MTFIFRNRTIFWDISKWNRWQKKWDGGSTFFYSIFSPLCWLSLLCLSISPLSPLCFSICLTSPLSEKTLFSSLSQTSLSLFPLSLLFTGLLVEIGIRFSSGDWRWFACGDCGFGCGMGCGPLNLNGFWELWLWMVRLVQKIIRKWKEKILVCYGDISTQLDKKKKSFNQKKKKFWSFISLSNRRF